MKLSKKSAKRRDNYVEQGNQFHDVGNWEKALSHYMQALSLDPKDYNILKSIGLCHKMNGDINQAVIYYEKSIALHPNNEHLPFLLNNTGMAYCAIGGYDKALCYLKDSVKLNPKIATAQSNLAHVYVKKGKYDKAFIHYQEAEKLAPDNSCVHKNLGLLYKKTGDYKNAIHHYEKANELAEKNPEWSKDKQLREAIYHGLGYAYIKQDMYPEGIKYYIEAIKQNLKNPRHWNNMGVAHDLDGNKEKAMQCYKQAITLKSPKTATLWNRIGCIYSELENWPEALNAYQNAVKCTPNKAAFWNNCAVAHNKLGNENATLICLQKALILNPEHNIAWGNICKVKPEHEEKWVSKFPSPQTSFVEPSSTTGKGRFF